MDTASSIVIVIPVMTPIALFTGIALPFIAASRSGRGHPAGPLARAGARKRADAAGRMARPRETGADDAAPAGYLYVPCGRIGYHGYPAGTRRWVQEVPIVKKTARLRAPDIAARLRSVIGQISWTFPCFPACRSASSRR